MEKTSEWSKLYGIESKTMKRLHSLEDSLGLFYNNPCLIHTILKRNSQLLQSFLASLPEPSKNARRMGISISFLLPTEAAFRALFESMFQVHDNFREADETATWYCDENGIEFYNGPTASKNNRTKIVFPTYVHTIGKWEKGLKHLVKEEMPKMIERDFFVYYMAIGDAYDHREKKMELGHRDVGVGGDVLCYSCSNGIYNPTSSIYAYDDKEDLSKFWKDWNSLNAKIENLDSKFFKKENKQETIEPFKIG